MKLTVFSLRLKAIILVLITTGVLVIVLGIFSSRLLLNSFIELENNRVTSDAQAALTSLENETDKLDSTNTDWAYWDDTYRYVIKPNQEYIDSNMMDEAFVNLNINLFLLVSNEGQIIFEKEYDLENNQIIPFDPRLEDYLRAHTGIIKFKNLKNRYTGICVIDGKMWIISSRAVLTSKMEGPSYAALILGRQLTPRVIKQLSNTENINVQIQIYNDASLPEDFSSVQSRFTTESRVIHQPLSENRIAAYALLDDVYGKPAVILRVDEERNIY